MSLNLPSPNHPETTSSGGRNPTRELTFTKKNPFPYWKKKANSIDHAEESTAP